MEDTHSNQKRDQEKRILIVEDERIIALDLKKRLERFGFPSPEIVSNGEDAITAAEKLQPDIILMDIMLGGSVDGIEAATYVKDNLSIPVIFLTAYSNENTLERAKAAEPYGYILKPFKERELYTTIEIALYKFDLNQQLKQQEKWLSAVLDSVEDGIIATGKDGFIQFMNPVAEVITGWKEADSTTHTLSEVFPITEIHSKRTVLLPDVGDEHKNIYPFIFQNCTLTNKSSAQVHVEGSVGIIRDRYGQIEGQVLAFRDVTEMRRMSDTISYQASHDTLTGLANREEFSARLETILQNAKQLDTIHSMVYLDIDQFRVINDICGHTAGDELLLKTTRIIRSVVRSSDLSARLGADEFGILLEDARIEQAIEIAKRLQARLMGDKLVWEKHVFNINTSIGIVPIDGSSESTHSVLAAADDACYIAKDEGGNRIKIYSNDENRFSQRRGEMQWISRLTKALEENRFKLYHQPIISLAPGNNGSKKSEILIRMVDTEERIISPADFIPAAERYNLMPAIDRWVIHAAFRYYKALDDRFTARANPFHFSINLSAAFLADENSLDYIRYEFQEFDISPRSFCFEITETAAITNMERATQFIHELKALGCTFALDDFGSGFSSFNYLRELPVDYLKIDGIFVKNMHEDSVNSAMVKAINSMGQFIGIQTIAEFVGNEEISNDLKSIGVNFGQGYHFGRPVPLEDLLEETP